MKEYLVKNLPHYLLFISFPQRISQHFVLQELSCVAVGALCYFFRRAGHHHIAASLSPFRTEVDDMVGTFDDVHVVLDDDDGVSACYECIEGIEQLLDVVEVQTRRGFVENEQGGFRLLLAEVIGQFDALVLSSR